MALEILQPQILPVTAWKDGTIRIGKTRVLLDLVVFAFKQGNTPEMIVENFPTITLAEAYGAITYYLENQDQIEAYLARRKVEAEDLWRKIESDPRHQQLRTKLQAQKNQS